MNDFEEKSVIQTAEAVARFVEKRIQSVGRDRRALGVLRTGIGKKPWIDMRASGFAFDGIPKDLCEGEESATLTEWVIYIAMTLYGLYPAPARGGIEFAKAMAIASNKSKGWANHHDRARRRMGAIFSATEGGGSPESIFRALEDCMNFVRHHGRGDTHVNYVSLARDVILLCDSKERNKTALRWGTIFESTVKNEE
jgi:hypothetical protein